MAHNGSTGLIKREYVKLTHSLLVEKGIENISVRDVAKEIGKTPPAVYRHFDSFDHLVAVSSIRFLIPYYNDVRYLAQRIPRPLDLNLQTWECFAYYAFQNIPIFENLFFKEQDRSVRALQEYFELFPEELGIFPDYLQDPMSSGSLEQRDLSLLNLAAEQGFIDTNDVAYLADCDIFILRGMMQKYRPIYREPDMAREATKRYMHILMKTYRYALLPGHELSFGLLGRSKAAFSHNRTTEKPETCRQLASSIDEASTEQNTKDTPRIPISRAAITQKTIEDSLREHCIEDQG